MSEASQLESEGTEALHATGGDSVTFRNSTLTVVLNRPVDLTKPRPGLVDRNVRDSSEVEVLVGSLSPAPKVGEHLTESNGLRHRIETVHRVGPVYRLTCKVEVAP